MFLTETSVDKLSFCDLQNYLKLSYLKGNYHLLTLKLLEIMSDTKYAGFWLRFVAILIDGLILGAINFVLLTPIMGMIGMDLASGMSYENIQAMDYSDIVGVIKTFVMAVALGNLVALAVKVLYNSFMEVSKFQGSVGKLALGLKVTDANGGKLTLVKAVLRNLGKIVSGMILLIGYIMAGFTEKKQALHDMFVGALVVKK